ncbi:hypothetical protein BS329_41435 [Amycolatopsis coloradensis]|uniref:Uncharacterized protein n=1 Tax=Amycolatopsis coloradensis TaxID=76021 RepID=A0A1R0KD48_9PSEU|nr:hypothetical protein BS329_41435 [Amycolatopsis coloradensis]
MPACASGAEDGRNEQVARRWQTWSPEASFFHYATQDIEYADILRDETDPSGRRDDVTADTCAETEGHPSHTMFTEYSDADRVARPRVRLTEATRRCGSHAASDAAITRPRNCRYTMERSSTAGRFDDERNGKALRLWRHNSTLRSALHR